MLFWSRSKSPKWKFQRKIPRESERQEQFARHSCLACPESKSPRQSDPEVDERSSSEFTCPRIVGRGEVFLKVTGWPGSGCSCHSHLDTSVAIRSGHAMHADVRGTTLLTSCLAQPGLPKHLCRRGPSDAQCSARDAPGALFRGAHHQSGSFIERSLAKLTKLMTRRGREVAQESAEAS